MTLTKKKVFRRIRSVCGREICSYLPHQHGKTPEVKAACATAHQLRQALMALVLILSAREDGAPLKRCPNCGEQLPEHGPRCAVARLLHGEDAP